MEDGDSDTDKYPHRTGNNAGHDFVHGTWTVQFLRKPLPRDWQTVVEPLIWRSIGQAEKSESRKHAD